MAGYSVRPIEFTDASAAHAKPQSGEGAAASKPRTGEPLAQAELAALGLVSALTAEERQVVVQAFKIGTAQDRQGAPCNGFVKSFPATSNDPKLRALWRYARQLTRRYGLAVEADRKAFYAAGYTAQTLLEVAMLHAAVVIQDYRGFDPGD